MRVVIDTNVVISGIFFGGNPRRILERVVEGELEAVATPEIVEEYREVVQEMLSRKQGRLRTDALGAFIGRLRLIESQTLVDACRDPDDNAFLACAVDARASAIISGDKDLLDLETFRGVKILTAADFLQ